jgi:hypothetical protein
MDPELTAPPIVLLVLAPGSVAALTEVGALPSVAAIRRCRFLDVRPAPTVEGDA